MRGVVLAGGIGSRLLPLTKITNKHCLPIYDKPMIFYPLLSLKRMGIEEVMVVVGDHHAGDVISLLRNGEEFGFKKLTYAYQTGEGGIADALRLAEDFADFSDICVILGDNTCDEDFTQARKEFEKESLAIEQSDGNIPVAQIFIKEVPDPQRYGCIKADPHTNTKILDIIEKPKDPPSNMAVTGIYFYDYHVFKFIERCSPSKRGELEITDVNKFYLNEGVLLYDKLESFWCDAGSFDTLHKANCYWRERNEHN